MAAGNITGAPDLSRWRKALHRPDHSRQSVRFHQNSDTMTTGKQRTLLAVAALLLIAAFYTPLWMISLEAPQYPEGLGLRIWVNNITGAEKNDLDKINNLNHYIGMKAIHPDSIPELKVMPYCLAGLIGLGLLCVVFPRRWLLITWLVAFMLLALAGLVDFYLWGYDYGHNLDTETAPIKIPGMTYQPPLIGSKKLLNFNALSLPALGGWIMLASFTIWAVTVYLTRRGRTAR